MNERLLWQTQQGKTLTELARFKLQTTYYTHTLCYQVWSFCKNATSFCWLKYVQPREKTWIVKLCARAYNSPVDVQMNGNLSHCCSILAWLSFCKFFMPWLHLYTFHQLFPFHPLVNTQFHLAQLPNLCVKQTKISFSSIMFIKCLWICKCSFIFCT